MTKNSTGQYDHEGHFLAAAGTGLFVVFLWEVMGKSYLLKRSNLYVKWRSCKYVFTKGGCFDASFNKISSINNSHYSFYVFANWLWGKTRGKRS